jgi:flagellar biosynthesis/type III secretory pathway chaperone
LASVIQELITVLTEEQQLYEKIIPIASEKKNVIIKNNLESLQEITEQEQLAIDQVTVLEKKRSEVIVNIGILLNRKPEELTLKEIIRLLENQPKEQKQLSQIHDQLKQTVQELKNINIQNKSLIVQSLEMIEFNMNLIQSTRMSPGNNYTKGAITEDAPALQAGTFDAKQ